MKLSILCPAKLNLFLAVGPKDARGYHPLRTIFQAIGLYDRLKIDFKAAKTSVEFKYIEVPADNTVTKALRLIAEFTDLPSMAIEVEKFIPTMAGLGGGSSNAAGLIRAVRKLFPERFSQDDAASVAAAVGADVPFFLVGGKAKGEGYGEILTPLPDDRKPVWAVVVMPPYAFSTPDMYARLDREPFEFRDFPPNEQQHNDFERVIPYGGDPMNRLGAFGGRHCGMTGSGSAQYALFDTREEAETAAGYVRSEDLGDTWVVPFLSRAESLNLEVLPD
jgi:4-diphosphocytidyl-2-C-methyl-D-erythritol kinase